MVHYQYLLITCSMDMKKDYVLKHFGSMSATAKALGISFQYVFQWADLIPQGMAYKIESVTGGVLKVDPELYTKKRVRRYAQS